MTPEELRVLPDATLIAIAKNVKHYEAKEDRDALVLELARRLEQWVTGAKALYSSSPANFLLKDGWE